MTARPAPPFFSLLLPIVVGYREPTVLASLRAQTHPSWELVVVVTSERAITWRGTSEDDHRVVLVPALESDDEATRCNAALKAASGTVVARVRLDDKLPPQTLATVSKAFGTDDDIVAVYGDREETDERGREVHTRLLPDWSLERLRSQDYVGGPLFFRARTAETVGGYRPALAGALDYDLMLRIGESGHCVQHLPAVLSRREAPRGRTDTDDTDDAACRALQDHLDRVGALGRAESAAPGRRRVRRTLAPGRSVSVIIPTAGTSALVWGERRVLVVEAVRSALSHTQHDDLEIVVVADDSTPPDVLRQLCDMAGEKLTVTHFREPFNFARKVNLGALVSRGERLVLLNDDTEVKTVSWLEQLVAPLDEPDLGVTGARLLYSNGTLQHAGLAAVPGGGYLHPFRGAAADDAGSDEELLVSREVTAVTGACLAVRREVFLDVGGLTEQLPSSYNDVDFCLKVRTTGRRVVLVRDCELFHFETMSRPARVAQWETDFVVRRWGRPDRDAFTPQFPELSEFESRDA